MDFVADFIDGGVGFLLGLEGDGFEVFFEVFDGFDEEGLEVYDKGWVYFVIERVEWLRCSFVEIWMKRSWCWF